MIAGNSILTVEDFVRVSRSHWTLVHLATPGGGEVEVYQRMVPTEPPSGSTGAVGEPGICKAVRQDERACGGVALPGVAEAEAGHQVRVGELLRGLYVRRPGSEQP